MFEGVVNILIKRVNISDPVHKMADTIAGDLGIEIFLAVVRIGSTKWVIGSYLPRFSPHIGRKLFQISLNFRFPFSCLLPLNNYS